MSSAASSSSASTGSGVSRRHFLAGGGAVAAAAFLAACGGGSSSSSSGGGGQTLKYWDMPWGTETYAPAAKKLTESYQPANGLPKASYQTIQWANFAQTFSSAVASKTNPAVSSGGGFQAFQFAEQGAIAYADNLIASWKKDGTYDDFLPGTVEEMKTPAGYVAVPSALDMRVWWYRKSLLDQAGVAVPTTWDELLTAAIALKKIGVYGFSAGAGTGNSVGVQQIVTMLINNGGGLFAEDGTLDVVNDRNIEAMAFVKELANIGAIDPASVSYTTDNQNAQWKNKKFAMGIETPGLDTNIGDTSGDVLVMSPLAGPHGDKGTLVFTNNLMMYKNNPSQEGTEAFLSYYIKNMKTLWQQNVMPGLPVLKSVAALPEFQAQKQKAKIIAEWQPVAKSFAAQFHELTPSLEQIADSPALNQFTHKMFAGKTDPKAALQSLQSELSGIIK